MCALCGVLGGGDHWTDPIGRDGVYVRAADASQRRRERLRRVLEANAMLGLFGLSLEDWQGSSYILRSRTGKTEMVDQLAALWLAAEKMTGRPIDPLDIGVLMQRERSNG